MNLWLLFSDFNLDKLFSSLLVGLLTHLAKSHESLCHGTASVRLSGRRQFFHLNDFFSRTTSPISTKHGRKHAWEMEI